MSFAMARQVLFVQGAGEGAYEEDAKLASHLGAELGADYQIHYPRMPNEDDPVEKAWWQRIDEELTAMGAGAVLVGHSAGAATLLTFLAQSDFRHEAAGIFIIAAPFFGEGGWNCGDGGVPKDLGARLPRGVPLFLYHGSADEIVPFAHVDLFAKMLPQAVIRRLKGRNHQLNDDLSDVANDIRQLPLKPIREDDG
jgi:predicted alpha/beta hydrolase family esterase